MWAAPSILVLSQIESTGREALQEMRRLLRRLEVLVGSAIARGREGSTDRDATDSGALPAFARWIP